MHQALLDEKFECSIDGRWPCRGVVIRQLVKEVVGLEASLAAGYQAKHLAADGGESYAAALALGRGGMQNGIGRHGFCHQILREIPETFVPGGAARRSWSDLDHTTACPASPFVGGE